MKKLILFFIFFTSVLSFGQNNLTEIIKKQLDERVAKEKEELIKNEQVLRDYIDEYINKLNIHNSNNYYDYNYRPETQIIYIKSYIKSNGTFVNGYYKTKPDDSFWNNWSSCGNVNPFTGKIGNKKK
ncbi:MAG: hypothetical protein NTU73_05790 [Ignavibacteriae bacterium]|nr:hypothetical protein [Ignavibacteriota bacterium]